MSESSAVVEPSRTSSLNRTMVISKRTSRPGLPQINDNDPPCLSEPISAPENLEAQQRVVHFRSGSNNAARRSHVRSATITVQSETMQEFQRAFEEIEKTGMPAEDKIDELRRRILALVDTTEKHWNAQSSKNSNNENLSEDKKLVGLKLEAEIAKQAALYADRFFKICERNGIDIEKVLKNDPDMIFNMKLKSSLPTPNTAEEQSKEIETLKKERENLADETKSLKASYSSLFRSYERLRSNYELLHQTRNTLAETAEKQKEAMQTIYESAIGLKDTLTEQVAAADQTIAETKGRYDSATVTIRMDLVRLENENSSLRSEMETKNKEIEELRMIIHEVVKQVSLEPV